MGSKLACILSCFNRKYKYQGRPRGKYLQFCKFFRYFFLKTVGHCHEEFEFKSDPTFVDRNKLNGELFS